MTGPAQEALRRAEDELAAAQAELEPLEAAWARGEAEPGAPPLPALPPGHFRMPGGPWPRLVAARARCARAEEARRQAVAAPQRATTA